MLSDVTKDAENRMQKCIENFKHDLAKLRVGRAHPSILESIIVEYYGNPTPLSQVATIVASDSRTLSVTPFEKTMLAPIDKAIRNSELGLNPASAGTVIRVPLPPLTEERRLALAKQLRADAEDAKVAIRNIRRDINNHTKSLLKDKSITEDEDRKTQDAIQKVTDKFVAEVDKIAKEREADLMHV